MHALLLQKPSKTSKAKYHLKALERRREEGNITELVNEHENHTRDCHQQSGILHGIAGKVIMYIAEKDLKDAAGSLEVCPGQEAGPEAATDAICDVYQQDQTKDETYDAYNAFISIKRKAMLHDISIACALITTFIANYYMEPARLFVVGNHEIKLREATKQADPTAMGAYALGVTPLIYFLSVFIFINEHRSK